MNAARLSALLGVLAAACGSSGADEASLEPIVLELSASVAAGGEAHLCQFVRLPEASDGVFVNGGSYDTSPGTHHFLLFRTSPALPEQPLGQAVDCYEGAGVMQYERGFVSGGQLLHDEDHFTSGLALAFQPGEVLLLQAHVVNTAASELSVHLRVALDRIAPETVTAKVGTFRFYNPYIYVPAQSAGHASMRCHLHHDVTLLRAGAHMHRRGVGYRAFVDLAGEPPAVVPFYTTSDWEHPEYWHGETALAAGSDIRYECDYQNEEAAAAIQGLSAVDDEMCMFSAFYHPVQDADEEQCASMDLHGTGTRGCAQTTSCLELCAPADAPHFSEGRADVGECWQKCIVDSCPAVTEVLFPQLTCTADKCATACAVFGAGCTACVVGSCKAYVDACQAQAGCGR